MQATQHHISRLRLLSSPWEQHQNWTLPSPHCPFIVEHPPDFRFRARQQIPDAKVRGFQWNVSFRTFERQLMEHDYVRTGCVFFSIRTLGSAGKSKKESKTASKENSTMMASQQNIQQQSRPGVEVVKASLDLTGKYPNTNKGRIGFLDECDWNRDYRPMLTLKR